MIDWGMCIRCERERPQCEEIHSNMLCKVCISRLQKGDEKDLCSRCQRPFKDYEAQYKAGGSPREFDEYGMQSEDEFYCWDCEYHFCDFCYKETFLCCQAYDGTLLCRTCYEEFKWKAHLILGSIIIEGK